MAGEVSAADGALQKGASIVSSSRQQLTGQLKGLEGKLAGLGAQWKGSGATAFTSVMSRWQQDSQKIIAALDNFEQNLKTSQSTYSSTDDSAQSSFNNLASRLG